MKAGRFVCICQGSFTGQNTVLCFDAFYNPSDAGDCLLLPPSSDASLSIVQQDASRGSEISNNLPNFSADVICHVQLDMSDVSSVRRDLCFKLK